MVGIAAGALIAAIALGVLLTYRGSGVVNFANGAIAMYIAYVYTVLRRDGDLFLPPLPNPLALVEGIVHLFQTHDTFSLPDIPTQVSFGSGMSFWPALVISLVFCVLLGLLLHFADLPAVAQRAAAREGRRVGRPVPVPRRRSIIRRFDTTPQHGEAAARSSRRRRR